MTQSSFFRAFASKEALLLELVRRMFGGQFALAEQHSGIEDPVLLYAVETSLQLHIAELTEPLRELYVVGYSLPTTSAYIYQSMAGRLQSIFGKYMPDLELKDFYEMEIASASIMRGFMAMPCDVYFTMEAKISRFLEPRFVTSNTISPGRLAGIAFTFNFLTTKESLPPACTPSANPCNLTGTSITTGLSSEI